MNIETVNELIQSLESAGELSIREQKFLKLAKEFRICSASLDAAIKAGNMLADQNVQLAAENVELKNVFSQKEIPSEAVDAFMETAVMDHDWNETSEWSWVENETEVIHAVLEALKPETPATDRIVAGIKADGVEMFALMFAEEAIKDNNITTGWKARASRAASEYAELLREGADK
ncbi:hypothetical protein AB9C65_16375 [Klebsiella pasteurii]|uniref:hypothetical protein n=1 Tax=Klebsiella pasteurii TaxID=2587529 RepID=UPI003511C1F8